MKFLKKISLLLLVCIPFFSNAQIYADPTYYLIDSLVLENLSKTDSILLDTCLQNYHQATDDTTQLNAIHTLVEECYDEKVWPRYNNWVYKDLKGKIKKKYAPDITNHFKKLLASTINNIGYYHGQRAENKEAIRFYHEALKISREIDDKETIATTLNNIGYEYDLLSNNSKALDYYHQSLDIRRKINEQEGIANSLNNLSTIYFNQGDISKAIVLCHESLKIREKIGDKDRMATSLNNLGFLYHNQGDSIESMRFYLKSLKIHEETSNKNGVATSLNNIGSIYEEKKQYDRALFFYNQSLNIRKETGDKDGTTYSLVNIGKIYQRKRELKKALEFYRKALEINKEIGNKKNISSCLNSIGEILFKQNKVYQAEKNAQESLIIAQEIGFPKNIQSAANLLSAIYEKQNKGLQALAMHKLFISMKDSLNNKETQKALIQQQTKYEYEKQKEIDDVQRDKSIAIEQEKKEKQKVLTIAAAIGLILVTIFLIFVFNRLTITRKQKLIIEKQKETVEIAHQKLGKKNQEILDSITYAKRIQSAILPPDKIVDRYLPESFILYLPKDIVAGDFYWIQHHNDKVLFAAADCTGHGVPGAMVSVVCNNALNRSVREYRLTEPGSILDKTREIVIQEFEKSDKNVQDGMDIAICCLEKNTLKYAGAHNPLWVIRNGEIIEIKANKEPIGQYIRQTPYTTHALELLKGDTIYIFSDGYVDQFGGENGKKYKAKAFRALLRSIQDQSMKDQKRIINDTFNAWKGELEQIDDVCVIGVRI